MKNKLLMFFLSATLVCGTFSMQAYASEVESIDTEITESAGAATTEELDEVSDEAATEELTEASDEVTPGWQKNNGIWYYYDTTGEPLNGWLSYKGSWYYLNEDGSMATGWIIDGDKHYFLAASGIMESRQGWVSMNGKWYYFDRGGAARTGWNKFGTKWYYLNPDTCAMATGWFMVENDWYLASSSGAMRTGWIQSGATWYYLKGSGAMATGWQKVNKKWYWFHETSGAMKTGWLQQNDKWYWLTDNGAAQDTMKKINGIVYAFDSSCVCQYTDDYSDYGMFESLSSEQIKVLNACNTVSSPGANLCAEWVSLVFQKAGYPKLPLDACDMANKYCNTSDPGRLEPGMIIAVNTHSHTYAGSIWGHVCIYIGNGKVMDNVGYIRVVDLNSWLWWYGDTVTPQWGWYNHYSLN